MDILSYTDWILAGSTVVLAGVTTYYAIQTRKLVIETRNLVSVPYRPSLMPILFPNPQTNNEFALKLKIENVGVGIATDVKMEYYYIEDDSKRTTTFKPQTISVERPLYPIEKTNPATPHRSSESILYPVEGLPSTEINYHSQHKVELKGELKCKDLFGKEHIFERF